ncbi:ABC transporter ATP-binding protein [Acutalibacter sp. 1XD8-36]|uniref:ABC transporter ATP-binding protein n=1 Tax=Acutalibacter sp. 1XD8-36 TaxID=2320852 RepID=UPI002621C82A|nr:ABC transporter ATP-binding protein [Acutalibacter sp. 1XD8-36]
MPPRFMPRGPIEKPKDRKKVLIRLWSYIYAHKFMALGAVLLTVGSNLLALLGPYLSGRAIDAIGLTKGGVDFPAVFFYCALMALFYGASAGLSYGLSILMIRLSQKIVREMRQQVFDRLTLLPVKYFDRHQTGDIVSHISYDIDTVNASLSNDLLQIAASVITVVGSLVMMIAISPVLVLVFVVTIPMSVMFTRYMTKKVRPLFHKRSVMLGQLNGFVEEVISGQKTTKAYHQEQTQISRFDKKNKEAVDAYYNAEYYGAMTGPSVNFINNLSLAFISVFGSILFLLQRISIGDLSSFVLYSRRFSGPINEMANIVSELQSACAAAERVFDLMDQPTEPEDSRDAVEADRVDGDVRMEHVGFGYEKDKEIIHDLSLHAPPGGLTAIVGPTGAGKTTLINLLMRFYDPDRGQITLDGRDIQDITRKSLRLSYAMVLQDTWLFTGTIFDNLAYGKKDAKRSDVEAAAKAARIHRYIMALPKGYDTILDENGINISQGQKQLLTIARAMLLDAKMLILDEATSNVDTRTEQQIQAAMRTLMKDKTCFVIAHRLSTIQNANNILVVRDGDIVEQGTHRELMERGGFYAGLYQSQFQ